ncbi:Tn3 family transposase, partial [Escherichia coli]
MGSCAAPSAKGDDKFITTDYLQQCPIKQGTVTASLMLRKLGSYPRQNGLAVALRELGRIERTLFIL